MHWNVIIYIHFNYSSLILKQSFLSFIELILFFFSAALATVIVAHHNCAKRRVNSKWMLFSSHEQTYDVQIISEMLLWPRKEVSKSQVNIKIKILTIVAVCKCSQTELMITKKNKLPQNNNYDLVPLWSWSSTVSNSFSLSMLWCS